MIKVLSKNQYTEWNEYVYNHNYGTIYHSSMWLNVINKSFGLEPLVIVKINDSIVGGMPFFHHKNLLFPSRLVSITNAHSCNPLVNNESDLSELIDYIQSYASDKAITQVEIKTTEDFRYRNKKLENPDTDFSTYILSLDKDYSSIQKSFHNSCIARPLKKAQNNNLKLIVGTRQEDVKIFYGFYEIMRKENGLLPQPLTFFINLWEELYRTNNCEIFHAEYEGKIISSVFNLLYKQTYTYEYGATDSNFLNLHPSHFLLDHSIKNALSKNFKYFDFGRTENSNIGLSDFKKRWGTRRINLNYFSIPNSNKISPIKNDYLKNVASAIIHLTPKPLYRVAGQIMYKMTV